MAEFNNVPSSTYTQEGKAGLPLLFSPCLVVRDLASLRATIEKETISFITKEKKFNMMTIFNNGHAWLGRREGRGRGGKDFIAKIGGISSATKRDYHVPLTFLVSSDS